MAIQTIYLLGTAAVTPNWFGVTQLNGTAPTAANSAFGYQPAKTAITTPYYRGRIGATAQATVAQAASYNAAAAGPTKGTGSAATTAGDSFIAGPFTGGFAAGSWVFNFNMRASTAGCIGRINMRIWRSANADGSAATQVLANTNGATVTLSTSADVNSSITTSAIGALALSNEYLFFQLEWQETTVGSSNGCNVLFRIGTSSITTPDFVASTANAWNANDKSTTITLTNTDKTATVVTGTSGVRSTQARANGTAGKYYAEFFLGNASGFVGILDTTKGLTSTVDGAVFVIATGGVSINTTTPITTAPAVTNDVVCMAWDAGTKKVWFRTNNGFWNGSASNDPATGVGGVDASALASVNHALWFRSNTVNASITVRTQVADLSYTVPSGFKSWMNETPPTPDGWNLNDKFGSAVFSNNDKTSINSSGTGAARSSKGYSTTGTNKLYVEFVAIYPGGSGDAVGLSPDTDASTDYTHTVNLQTASNQVRLNNTSIGPYGPSAYVGGDVLCCAWDIQAKRLWARTNNGLWNNSATADPAAGVGGYDVSSLINARYCLWYTQNFSNCGATIRTTLADLGYDVPSGFTSWMGETQLQSIDNAWNVKDKSSTITLSNGDKTALGINGVRSTYGWFLGEGNPQFYAEFVINALNLSNGVVLGLAKISQPLTDPYSPNGFCITSAGFIVLNGSIVDSSNPPLAVGDVISLALDCNTSRGWLRLNSRDWNNNPAANPATATGGFDLSALTNSSAYLTNSSAHATNSITIRTQAVEFTRPVPAGFLSWMGESVGPPPDAIPAATPYVDSPPTIPSSTIWQTHVWASTSFSVSALALPAGVLKQIHALSAPLTATAGLPVFGTATLAVLVSIPAATPLAVVAPAINVATLQQKHVLPIATPLAVPSPTVASAAFKQIHALPIATAPVVPAPSIAAGTLKQVHALGATSLAVGTPAFDAPALALTVPMVASSIAVSIPTVGASTFQQRHTLQANALAVQPPVYGTATIVIPFIPIVANDLSATAPALGTPALQPTVLLAASNLATAPPVEASAAISQVHALGASALASSPPAITVPAFNRTLAVTASPLAVSAPTVGVAAFAQPHTLTANALATSLPVFGAATISQAGVLAALPLVTVPPTLDQGALAQKHVLTATALALNPPALAATTLTQNFQNYTLTAAALTIGVPVIAAAALGQSGVMAAIPIAVVQPTLGAGSLTQKHVLAGSTTTTNPPVIASAILLQQHWFSATSVATTPPSVGASALGQQHALAAIPVTVVAPVIPAAALGQSGVMACIPIPVGSPIIGAPAIGQKHVAAAQSLAAGPPALDSTSLSKVLSAKALAVGAPVISPPLLTKVLTAAPLSAGAPVLGTPTCALQVFNLTAVALAIGPPTIPALSIGQSGAMAAVPPAVGSPVLGAPTIGQRHVLPAAVGATVGAPVLAASAIGGKAALGALPMAAGAPALGPGVLRQEHRLSAQAASAGRPVLGIGYTGQAGVMAAIPLWVGSPVLPAIAPRERQRFTGNGFTVGPPFLEIGVLGVSIQLPRPQSAFAGRFKPLPAVLGQVHPFTAQAVSAGAPRVPVATMFERESFREPPLVVSSPVLGAPALVLITNFKAIGLTPRPELGRPTIGQEHRVRAATFAVGRPWIGYPRLGKPPIALDAIDLSVGIPVFGALHFVPLDHLLSVVNITSRQRLTPITGQRPSVTISNTQRAAPLTGERNSRVTIIGRRGRNVI